MNLKHLTDQILLKETKRLSKDEREITTTILHHLKEVERRKLFSELGYSSMLAYAIKELNYSEGSASRRLQSARLLAAIPELEDKINDGSLTLSNLSMASGFFAKEEIQNTDDKKDVLEKLEGLSSREAEKKLFEMAPEKPLPKESIKPVSATFTQIKINVSDETYNLMNEARAILGEYSFSDSYMSKLSREAIQNVNRRKYKFAEKGRETETGGRTPTNSQKRGLYEHYKGKCEKCGSMERVQADHRFPYALGGKTEASNLRLLCFHCNQRERIKAKL